MSLLAVEHLGVGYGDTQVLWDVGLSVDEGEIVALVGANGAGKTTLMRTIAGLEPVRSGRITFNGEDISVLSAEERVKKGIAMVPEGRRLFAGLTVEQNLKLGAFGRKDKRAIARDLERIYTYFPKLGTLRGRISGLLSGGEQQMCAVGRALMSQPRLLLLDEMSLGLAPVIVEQLAEVVLDVNRSFNCTTIVVEQDVELGLEMSSRAYVLQTGRVVISGSSQSLLQHSEIQEAFLGLSGATETAHV